MNKRIEDMKKDVVEFSKVFLWNFEMKPYQEEFIKKIASWKKITLRQPRIYPTFKWKKIPMIYEEFKRRDNWNNFNVIIIDDFNNLSK